MSGTHQTCHYKLVLLGDTAVGKSCLVVRFVRDEFFEFQEPTIGAAFLTQRLVLDNTTVAAHLFAAQSECFQGHDGSDDSESDGLSDADAQGDNPTTAPVDGRKRLPSLSQNMKPAAVAVTEI